MSTPEAQDIGASAEARPSTHRTACWQFAAACAAIFAFVYALNAATPLLADDYVYAFVYGTPDRVESISQLLRSQWLLYFNWTGRVVGTSIYQAFVWMGRPGFNILNAAAFLIVVVLMYANANGLRRIRPSLLVGIALLLWFSLPVFGQSILWMSASVVYLWMLIPGLLVLIPFRLHDENPARVTSGWAPALGMGLLGILAGWSVEPLAVALVVLLTAFLVRFHRRGVGVPAWALAGMGGVLAGTLALLVAPGNYVRVADVAAIDGTSGTPMYLMLIERTMSIAHGLFLYNFFALLVLFAICAALLASHHRGSPRDTLWRGGLYVGAGLAATVSMTASPQFPARVWIVPIVFAVIGIGVVYSSLDFDSALVRRLVLVAVTAGIAMFAVKFAYVYWSDIRVTSRQWNERIAYIQSQKAQGNLNLVVPPITALTPYNAAYGITDLDTQSDQWPNADVARYFGLESIRTTVATDLPAVP